VGEYRIVSGVEMPSMRVYVEDGVLKSAIETMRVSGMPVYIDDEGNLFNRYTRFLSKVCYGMDGRARKLTAYEASDSVVLSAERD
jgi:hypothetical protein